jgi:hypothetical protein
MSRPSVVILCPREFKFTDHEATIERPFLADAGTSARLTRAAVLSEPLWNRAN